MGSSEDAAAMCEAIVHLMMALAQDIGGEGFSDMQNSDLLEIIQPKRSQPSAADIKEILEDSEQAQVQGNSGYTTESSFSIRALVEILNAVQNAIDQAFDKDPILTRSLKFEQDCDGFATLQGVVQRFHKKLGIYDLADVTFGKARRLLRGQSLFVGAP
ncbi:hypothetical protein QAD02_024134 [Eretmocerus hayati]|uniref:Uncharacterized protein n=1 Tax=Eretmocerus hayati TaxID=131215 RepID=A0ACC2Q0E7_9HYME|nr:hypothetical protein QAD02_024134 [Eretmocerus hayati]